MFSVLQENIFTFAAEGTGNALIEAVAGSGKTTTICEAVKRVLGTHVFLAFNKSIATELQRRGLNARTFHSLCYSPVLRARGAREVNANKLRQLIDANMGDEDAMMYGSFCVRLVGLARQAGVHCLVKDEDSVWCDLAELHDLEPESDRADFARGTELARKLLETSNESPECDFDDLLYFAVLDGISLPKFDNVFVDEAQDTNAIQRALLRKIMKPTSRMFAVGDPAQAIYGFRGADSNSLDLLAEEFGCQRFPLSITYRCGSAIVEFAQQWVAHIESAPNAHVGSVEKIGGKWEASRFVAADLIVCRTTKPLIKMAYGLLRAGVPANIRGRDIGEGLEKLVGKMRAKGIDALVAKLTEYTRREVEMALAKKQESKAESIQDKTDCVLFLIDALDELDRTIPALVRSIRALFEDKAAAVILSTIHKAKGLEADRVYWLNSSQCPSKWARQEWQKKQELNLCYVAATRAKHELILIEEVKAVV